MQRTRELVEADNARYVCPQYRTPYRCSSLSLSVIYPVHILHICILRCAYSPTFPLSSACCPLVYFQSVSCVYLTSGPRHVPHITISLSYRLPQVSVSPYYSHAHVCNRLLDQISLALHFSPVQIRAYCTTAYCQTIDGLILLSRTSLWLNISSVLFTSLFNLSKSRCENNQS